MYFILFIILTFLPMIGIGQLRIPGILLFFLLFLNIKKLKYNKILLKKILFAVLIFVLLLIIPLLFNGIFNVKYMFYPFITVYYYIIYILFDNIMDSQNINKYIKIMKCFIVVQLILCIIQMTNVLNINSILENLYYYYQQNNALKFNDYLEISYRPFGTVGSPIFMSVILYLFSKSIEHKENKSIFKYISILTIFLSGSRMVIISILICEFIEILKNKKSKQFIILLLFFVIGFLCSPFLQKIFNIYTLDLNSLLNEKSISYRLSMVVFLLDNIKYSIFGGLGIIEFPEYIDSEYIERILQFGIIGFYFMIKPYMLIFKDIYKKNKKIIITSIFLLLNMITSMVLTNFYLIPYIIISLIVIKKSGELHEDNTYNN